MAPVMDDTQLIISGLSSLDEEELLEAVGDKAVQFVRPEAPEGTLAEPGTITVIIVLGTIALNGLVAWLAKGRRRRTSNFRYRIVRPNGETVEMELDLSDSSEEALQPKVLAEISKWVPSLPSGSES